MNILYCIVNSQDVFKATAFTARFLVAVIHNTALVAMFRLLCLSYLSYSVLIVCYRTLTLALIILGTNPAVL